MIESQRRNPPARNTGSSSAGKTPATPSSQTFAPNRGASGTDSTRPAATASTNSSTATPSGSRNELRSNLDRISDQGSLTGSRSPALTSFSSPAGSFGAASRKSGSNGSGYRDFLQNQAGGSGADAKSGANGSSSYLNSLKKWTTGSGSQSGKSKTDSPAQSLDSRARGKVSPFLSRLQMKDGRLDYPPQVQMIAASNSEYTVGYMDMPGARNAMTMFSRALVNNMGKSKSLEGALARFAGRRYSAGLNAKPLYWRAKTVGGDDYRKSEFNVKKQSAKSAGEDKAETIYFGASGSGPVSTFKNSVQQVGAAMKKHYGAKRMFAINASTAAIDRGFAKIAAYAKKNKDKPIRLVFNLDTHGNHQTRGTKEGAGVATTLNINENQLKRMLHKHFGSSKNVGINLLMSACHSGGFLC